VDDETLEAGRREYIRCLEVIATAKKAKEWTGYEQPDSWRLPGWALHDREAVALMVNG
jgi:hypothetical protein